MFSTVWFTQKSLYEQNILSYESKHNAYIGNVLNIQQGVEIVASTVKPMDLGETALVFDDNTMEIDKGTSELTTFYNFLNKGTSPHTCGLSSLNSAGIDVPICATDLHGKCAVGIEPLERVFLCFSSTLHKEGTVLLQTSSPGYVVDLTDESMQGAVVTYDMDKGWSTRNPDLAEYCTCVPANYVFKNILNISSSKKYLTGL